jgi:hypothetical protein
VLTSRVTSLAVAAVIGMGALVAACSDEEAGSAEELCATLGDGRQLGTTLEGFDPTDTDTALEQLRDARLTLGQLRTAAPGVVRGDLSVEIDYVQALIEALEEVGPNDPTAAVAAVRRATEDHPDVQQAADRLEAWSETSC